MKEKIQQLEELRKNLVVELKEWVKDRSIPLDERWKVFITSELGTHSGSSEEFENFPVDDYYDKFYWEKYQTIDVNRMYTVANGYSKYNGREYWTKEQADEFREDVLEQFIKSFEHDW